MKKMAGDQGPLPILFGYNLLDTDVKVNIMILTVGIYFVLAAFFYLLLKSLTKMPFVKTLFLACHFTRACYALVAILCGLYTVFYSEEVSRDLVHGKSAASVLICTVSISFTILDTASYFVTGVMSDSKAYIVFLVHHIVMIPLYWSSVVTDTGYYFGSTFLLVELGFLAMPATIISGSKFARSLMGKIICMVGIHFFHLRNFIELHLWLLLYRNWDILVKAMPTSVLVSFIIMLSVISIILTPLWMYGLSLKLVLENFSKAITFDKKEPSKGKKNM